MRFWQRWFGVSAQDEPVESVDRRPGYSTKAEEAHLKAELRQLQQQREALEQRGCFSDRELEAKDRELEALDERIKAVKSQQFRLRTQGKLRL